MPEVKCGNCGELLTEAATMCPVCKKPLTASRIFRFHSTMPERKPAAATVESSPPSPGGRAVAMTIGGSILSIAVARMLCESESDALLYGAVGSGASLLIGAILFIAARGRSPSA